MLVKGAKYCNQWDIGKFQAEQGFSPRTENLNDPQNVQSWNLNDTGWANGVVTSSKWRGDVIQHIRMTWLTAAASTFHDTR